MKALSAAAEIRTRCRVEPVAGLRGVKTYRAHSGSGLSALGGEAPYWAYEWAGGLVLCRYLREHKRLVRGRRVLDLGAGSGIAGIVAAQCGAATVLAAESDRLGRAAICLNAALNRAAVHVLRRDVLSGELPAVDLILGGDIFYRADVAHRMTCFLKRCHRAGIAILVGDPGRADLPRELLTHVGQYCVSDFADPTPRPAGVFTFASRLG